MAEVSRLQELRDRCRALVEQIEGDFDQWHKTEESASLRFQEAETALSQIDNRKKDLCNRFLNGIISQTEYWSEMRTLVIEKENWTRRRQRVIQQDHYLISREEKYYTTLLKVWSIAKDKIPVLYETKQEDSQLIPYYEEAIDVLKKWIEFCEYAHEKKDISEDLQEILLDLAWTLQKLIERFEIVLDSE